MRGRGWRQSGNTQEEAAQGHSLGFCRKLLETRAKTSPGVVCSLGSAGEGEGEGGGRGEGGLELSFFVVVVVVVVVVVPLCG